MCCLFFWSNITCVVLVWRNFANLVIIRRTWQLVIVSCLTRPDHVWSVNIFLFKAAYWFRQNCTCCLVVIGTIIASLSPRIRCTLRWQIDPFTLATRFVRFWAAVVFNKVAWCYCHDVLVIWRNYFTYVIIIIRRYAIVEQNNLNCIVVIRKRFICFCYSYFQNSHFFLHHYLR